MTSRPSWVTITLWVAGGLVIAAGLLASARAWQTDGIAPFLVAGVALIALAVVEQRLTKVDLEGLGAKASLSFEEFASDVGISVAKEIVRLGLSDLAVTYATIHGDLRAHISRSERVELQSTIVHEARRRTLSRAPDPDALAKALTAHSKASRMLALGVAMGHPHLIGVKTVVVNIETPLSANEQYHALELAGLMVPSLDPRERSQLLEAAAAAPYIRDDPGRTKALAALREAVSRSRDPGDADSGAIRRGVP